LGRISFARDTPAITQVSEGARIGSGDSEGEFDSHICDKYTCVFGGVADRREKQKRRVRVMTLRELRQQSKKTAAEVAAALCIAISTYYGYEHGIRRICFEHVLTLAKLYDVSAEEIIHAQLKTEKERE